MGFASDFTLTLRFFTCGFFGDTESCFNTFDKSRTFVLTGGVTGQLCSNEVVGVGKVEGRARSVGIFLWNSQLM